MAETIKNTIAPLFAAAGIPDYIWLPIAANESSWTTTATNINDKETSKGLFQINVKAHPEYLDEDLFDPIVNTRIAISDFIGPAYSQAKAITSDPMRQALIVYSGLKNPDAPKEGYLADGAGIRPKWTAETRSRFEGYYDKYAGSAPQTGAGVEMQNYQDAIDRLLGNAGATDDQIDDFYEEGNAAVPGNIVKWVIIGIVGVVLVVSGLTLFKGETVLKVEGGMIK